MRSSEVSTSTTGWPGLAVTLFGWNSNFFALMRIFARPRCGETRSVPPARCRASSAIIVLRCMASAPWLPAIRRGVTCVAPPATSRVPRPLPRHGRVIGERRPLGLRARGGQGEDQRVRRVMGDVAGHAGDAPDGCGRRTPRRSCRASAARWLWRRRPSSSPASACRSNNGRWVSTTMRSSGLALLEVGGQPGELLVAQLRGRVGDIVEGDEVHALVVEGVVAGRRRTPCRPRPCRARHRARPA